MSVDAAQIATGSAFKELTEQIDHYHRQKKGWASCYYATKLMVIILGAGIPVMTTIGAWPWLIAVVGGAIAAAEGISQLWHFHDRYVAARVLRRGFEKERILYESGAAPYGDENTRETELAQRILAHFDTYESQVLSALKPPPGDEPKPG